MSEIIRTIPIFRLIIPFIIGIIFQVHLKIELWHSIYVLAVIGTINIIVLTSKKLRLNYNKRWISGILIHLFMFYVGLVMVSSKNTEIINYKIENKGVILGKISEVPKYKNKTIKLIIELIAVNKNKQWEETKGKVLVYVKRDSTKPIIEIGDRLVFTPNFQEIKNAKNPNEFDYKNYMKFHLITHQSYLESSNWKLIKNNDSWLKRKAERSRNNLIKIYEDYGIKGNELAIISALTLGYKDKLDLEIKKKYSATGAMHILAVSGLHVGIIFVVFTALLKFLNRNKYTKFIKAILLISILWFYAILTGMSASVLRSSLMFTMIIIAQTINRNSNIYNTIASSAFLLLFINPFNIYDVGFQLSYLAVLGIVYFQPKIQSLIIIENKYIEKIWILVSVSIAAQISTAPISIYYFNQFPNLFILTNIIVIPLTVVIIYTTIAFILTSSVMYIGDFFGYILNKIVWILNYLISIINNIPHSLSALTFNLTEVLLLYMSIILLAIFAEKKQYKFLNISLLIFAIFTFSTNYEYYINTNQKRFIIYNIKNESAYNFIDGKDNVLISSVKAEENNSGMMYNVKNNWIKSGVENEKIINIKKLGNKYMLRNIIKLNNKNIFIKNNYVKFYNTKMLLVNNKLNLTKSTKRLKLDYIIVSNNTKIEMKELVKNYDAKIIIFDSSNSTKKCTNYKNQLIKLKQKYYDVNTEGAFVSKI